MIAKCVAILAVIAQINGYVVSSGCGNSAVVGSGFVGSSGCGNSAVVGSGFVGSSGLVGTTGVVGASNVVGTSGVVGASGVVGSSAVIGAAGSAGATVASRNIVAKGKYPVTLENTGPVPDARVQVSTSHVQAPVQQKPTVRLSARIPAPRTVAHSCTCYKQILRPRVHDQYITVPTVQRYIETTHTPVVENIQYEAVPVNCPSFANSQSVLGASSVSQVVPVSSVQAFPVSSVQSLEAVPVSSIRSFSGLRSQGCYC